MPHGYTPGGGLLAELEDAVAVSCWPNSVAVSVAVLPPEGLTFSFSPCWKEREKKLQIQSSSL